MSSLKDLLSKTSERDLFIKAAQDAVLKDLLGLQYDSMNLDRLMILAASIDSAQYASKFMKEVMRSKSSLDLLTLALGKIEFSGLNLEFGVYSGRSINHCARFLPEQTFYGFDSFEGLPEAWREGYDKGHFAVESMPNTEANVELVKGWFDRTIPFFVDRFPNENVSFLHVDCDIYSSTQAIFHHLHKKIVAGTIIVFDEYINYPGWREHEWLAFKEFVDYHRMSYEYIGFVPSHQQVAVRIIK